MIECFLCEFWKEDESNAGKSGHCRKDAPRINEDTGAAQWPYTMPDDFCGQGARLKAGYPADPQPVHHEPLPEQKAKVQRACLKGE